MAESDEILKDIKYLLNEEQSRQNESIQQLVGGVLDEVSMKLSKLTDAILNLGEAREGKERHRSRSRASSQSDRDEGAVMVQGAANGNSGSGRQSRCVSPFSQPQNVNGVAPLLQQMLHLMELQTKGKDDRRVREAFKDIKKLLGDEKTVLPIIENERKIVKNSNVRSILNLNPHMLALRASEIPRKYEFESLPPTATSALPQTVFGTKIG